ncbi:MAG: phosphate ABC transporter permease PstA [Ilumatobacteraceae bacterium]
MTTSTTTSLVTPRRPWVNRRDVLKELIPTLVIASALAAAIVNFTGLAGPLGSYVAFVAAYLSVSFLFGMRHDKIKAVDKVMTTLVCAGFFTAFIPWVSILFTVFKRGASAIYWGYFTSDMSVTSGDDELNMGGLSHAIVGSGIILLIASLIAIPFGIITAVYITEIKGRLSGLVRIMIQSMSGVPSIVAGLFVFAILVSGKGFSAISGAVALSILMLPTVARTAEEVLKLVPEDIRTSAYALGATQTATTFRIVLPAARAGLVTASMLGMARVAGETAPLIMTSFYSANFSTDTSGHPLASLPMYIYQNFTNGTDLALSRAWGGAAVLLSIIFIIFTIARLASGRAKG